jgi:quercetin 2,3-dioxygenase
MSDLILAAGQLGPPPWPTLDPFLFCVHHVDAYPNGNEAMGPDAPLDGRRIGMDFAGKDGWNMYHGDVIPGFPAHPHRGFETVTVARRGFIDHSDSMGATARFGQGDCQWMTAGRGVVHSEMFPLVRRDADNPAELFQIWLNLPAADKMVEPHFAMLWSEEIPEHTFTDEAGRTTRVTTVAGSLDGVVPPSPPPSSWGARPDADLAIWTLRLEPGATWTLPPAASAETGRVLYLFEGARVRVGPRTFSARTVVQVAGEQPVPIEAGEDGAQILMLQGRPIGEPVAQQGPFVMNTKAEIGQAFQDYQRTRFGGWPWDSQGPVHPRAQGRFAIHADGRREEPAGGTDRGAHRTPSS